MKRALIFLIIINLIRVALIIGFSELPYSWASVELLNDTPNFFNDALVGWLTYLGVNTTIYGYLILFFSISLITQWAFLLLISKVIRKVRYFDAWAIMASTLSMTIVSVTVINDTFLVLFWTLSLLVLYRAIFNDHKLSWLLGGLFMGFTLLIKLSGFALPAGLILFLIFSSRYRKFIYTPYPYLALAITAIFAIPVFKGLGPVENTVYQFNLIDGFFNEVGLKINTFNAFILSQVTLLLPILYIGLWWVTFKYLNRIFNKPNQINAELWFMLSFFLPLFLGFHLISVFNWVDAFGLMPVYISGLIVLLKLIKPRWILWTIGLTTVVHVLILLLVFLW